MEHIYVMVTGPAASGKSTLCNKLCVNLPAFFYKPADAYFALAKIHNIPRERVFYDVDLEELANHFSNTCLQHDIAIGDQHLAIQHNRDSALAVEEDKKIDLAEPFVSAVDYNLFDVMQEKEIKPIIIYLTADPNLLYERAYNRNLEIGHVLRNKSLEDVKNEIEAEDYFYHELINKKELDSIKLNTSTNDINTVYEKAKSKVLEYR